MRRDLPITVGNITNEELEAAFEHWKTVGYRDYNPMHAYLVSMGDTPKDADLMLYLAFCAGYESPRLGPQLKVVSNG